MDQPKSLCLGRYKIVKSLGRSEWSAVYSCYDKETDEQCAVKVLSLRVPDPAIVKAMYQREVGALEGFSHPSVVQMLRYQAEEDEGRLNIVLELIGGGITLEALIADSQAPGAVRRPLRWRFEQLLGLLDGLSKAHKNSVIHRDVKLSNVLWDRERDVLKLVDFGIARLLENYGRSDAGATLRSFYTTPYAAPEQVRGLDSSFPADLHAFGVVAAALLAWRIPTPTFRCAELGAFMAPFVNEVGDEPAARKLVALLEALLDEAPDQRPKAPNLELALREALEKLGEKNPATIRITRHARERARGFNFRNDDAICADLNTGLRFRYEESKDPEQGSDGIRCYGKSLQAVLRPERDNPDLLAMTDLVMEPPANHAKRREHAASAPFTLTIGAGDAKAFITYAYQHFLKQQQAESERSQKQDLLTVARFILERQRERMTCFSIPYSLDGNEEMDRGQVTPSAGSAPPSKDLVELSGKFVDIKVHNIATGDEEAAGDDSEQAEALTADWADQLSPDSVFLYGTTQFATAHGYDPSTRTLTLRLNRKIRLPRRGALVCKDLAMEISLKRQEMAITSFLDDAAVNPRLGRLLLHPDENSVEDQQPCELIQALEPRNAVQSMVERALASRDFFLVQGPPGTGKTTLITELMAQILRADPSARILLTSQANEAVNNALDALREQAAKLKEDWRLVRDASVQAAAKNDKIGFDYEFANWAKETRGKSEQAAAALNEVSPNARAEVAAALLHWQDKLAFVSDVKQDYAESVQVFGMTCMRVPTLWRLLQNVRFDWVIVDEAARATPAELLVPLVVGKRFILVGDHHQLPPFMDTETAEDLQESGFDVDQAKRSLFERLFEQTRTTNKETLRRQFRMHRSIGDMVGRLFYADVGLETGVDDKKRDIVLDRFNQPSRVFWVNVHGRERKTKGETSYWNQEEIVFIKQLVERIEEELRAKKATYSLGIIASYGKQAELLDRELRPRSKRWSALRMRVDTVHAFQGKEDDIIIYSLVRANTSELRFVSDRRMLNVSFSRAKRLLVIVGHQETALNSSQLSKAIEMLQKKNTVTPEEVL